MSILALTISNQTVVITGDNLAVTVGGEHDFNSSMESHEAGNATERVVASPVKPVDEHGSGALITNSGNNFPSAAPAVVAVADAPSAPHSATAPILNPQPTSSPVSDKAGEPQDWNKPVSGSPATNHIIALRPLCQSPNECAGYGSHTCHSCLKAAESAGRAA